MFADDPPAGEAQTVIAIDESRLLADYYALPRELAAQTAGRGPGLSGAEDFAAFAVTGDLILGIHRALLGVLDDPEQTELTRTELQDELIALQAQAEEAEDVDLSIGRDGLAFASRTAGLQSVLGGHA